MILTQLRLFTLLQRGPPKGYIEAIEGRLNRLEALLGSVIQEDDPRFQAILDELNSPLETAYGELVRSRPTPIGQAEASVFNRPAAATAAASVLARNSNNSEAAIHNSPTTSSPAFIKNDTTQPDANDNLGNLSVDEGGQLRYYGKSSGFYMLRNSKNFQNGAFHFNQGGSSILPKSLSDNVVIDPYELPPADLSQHLLDLYFTHFYPLLPLLHKKSFLANLDKQPPLLLNSIYAVASRISTDERVRSNPQSRETAGDVFLERAMILLDFEWDDFRVSTVQSLLLLSSHQNGALKNIRGWLYSGLVSFKQLVTRNLTSN
jgi:hypothetical protein